MATLRLLRSTYGSRGNAQAAAQRLIERRLAACVHVSPLWATYRWEGKVAQGDEWLLEARCLGVDVDAVWADLLDGHPFDTPLVEVVGESTVPARYAAWAKRVTKR